MTKTTEKGRDANHKYWVVTNPTQYSEIEDICFEASLKDLYFQFKGGLEIDENPTLFDNEADAKKAAIRRIHAVQALAHKREA